MADYRYRNNFISAPSDLTGGSKATTGANVLSITIPAGAAGVKNVLKRVRAELSVTGAQTSLQCQAFDGSVSTAALLWSGNVQPAASGSDRQEQDDIDIAGSAATAMLIQLPAPAAGSVQTLFAQGYTNPKTSGA